MYLYSSLLEHFILLQCSVAVLLVGNLEHGDALDLCPFSPARYIDGVGFDVHHTRL